MPKGLTINQVHGTLARRRNCGGQQYDCFGPAPLWGVYPHPVLGIQTEITR
jgi:hypothetical protein